jgi:hypothetical protein
MPSMSLLLVGHLPLSFADLCFLFSLSFSLREKITSVALRILSAYEGCGKYSEGFCSYS